VLGSEASPDRSGSSAGARKASPDRSGSSAGARKASPDRSGTGAVGRGAADGHPDPNAGARLDAAAARQWCTAGLDALRRSQREIDELNVYPVPDGDTGTNLVLTVTSAHRALMQEPESGAGTGEPTLGWVLRRMARGALLGARGNSGVIISQLLTGMADALAGEREAGGTALARALREAEVAAYAAVAEPVEGTVLSVARAAADAAAEAGSDDLVTVLRAAATGAAEELARTPEQLPALARAGVVDAGGQGLVVLLDALLEVVTGVAAQPLAPRASTRPLLVARETGSGEYSYEVQYLLDAEPAAVEALRVRLMGLGDSLVVVGAGASRDGVHTWNVHVHVNDVGAAIEAGVEAGRPHRISVTRFADQTPVAPPPGPASGGAGTSTQAGEASARTRAGMPGDRPSAGVAGGHPVAGAVPESAAVAVATGDGATALFAAEGAAVVPGPSPSTTAILDGIRRTGAKRVVVLPSDQDVHPVAGAAAAQARAEGIDAGVVPTRSPVQALAALAVRDPRRRFEDDLIAMAEAAGACRYAEVTTAARAAVTVAGVCQPGDVLAFVAGEVNLVGKDLPQTCRDLLDRMLAGGGELVTLLVGEQAPEGLAETLAEHLGRVWPFVEVQVFEGGQPHCPLLVGVE
jgi:DAK2 domain fusion protein YloV